MYGEDIYVHVYGSPNTYYSDFVVYICAINSQVASSNRRCCVHTLPFSGKPPYICTYSTYENILGINSILDIAHPSWLLP